jgi:hypothetical protein
MRDRPAWSSGRELGIRDFGQIARAAPVIVEPRTLFVNKKTVNRLCEIPPQPQIPYNFCGIKF